MAAAARRAALHPGAGRQPLRRKGHRFVDYDVLMVAGEGRPVMSVHHTAIYDVRRADAAG